RSPDEVRVARTQAENVDTGRSDADVRAPVREARTLVVRVGGRDDDRALQIRNAESFRVAPEIAGGNDDDHARFERLANRVLLERAQILTTETQVDDLRAIGECVVDGRRDLRAAPVP